MIFLFIIISRPLSLFFLVETKQIENAMMVMNIKTTNLDIIWLLSILIVFTNSFINLIPSFSHQFEMEYCIYVFLHIFDVFANDSINKKLLYLFVSFSTIKCRYYRRFIRNLSNLFPESIIRLSLGDTYVCDSLYKLATTYVPQFIS